MGLKISELLAKKQISFDSLRNKKIAVDASNMLFQFISSIMQRDGTPLMDSRGNATSHLVGIFSRISNLMQRSIKLCFVFDGKPPVLKLKEQRERASRKQSAIEKLQQAKEEEDIELMLKYSKQSSRLTQEMLDESKELIAALGLPVIQAPSEADAQLAYMCRNGDVWAAATSDADVLVYGCPRIITNLTISQRKKTSSGTVKVYPEIIELKPLLEGLNITNEQLLSIAILTGTDYNPGGIHGIGQKKALKLVRDYAGQDALFSAVKPDFDWKAVRDTFITMRVDKDYVLEWKQLNKEKIISLLVEKHDFSHERVINTLDKFSGSKQKGLGDFA